MIRLYCIIRINNNIINNQQINNICCCLFVVQNMKTSDENHSYYRNGKKRIIMIEEMWEKLIKAIFYKEKIKSGRFYTAIWIKLLAVCLASLFVINVA